MLTRKDKTARTKFARKVLQSLPKNFWQEGISFYFDGVGFTHKTNPLSEARCEGSMAWRKPCEGLTLTSKGKKAGTSGRQANFFVAISYDKGVVCCEQYTETLTGTLFADFVREYFPMLFSRGKNQKGKLFL